MEAVLKEGGRRKAQGAGLRALGLMARWRLEERELRPL